MRMAAGLDSGPVFSERSVVIAANETAGELHDRLATLGGETLVSELASIIEGKRLSVEQDATLVTYAGKIHKQDAEIDWTLPAEALHRHIRAYNPVPGAYFFTGGVRASEGLVRDTGREYRCRARHLRAIRQGRHPDCLRQRRAATRYAAAAG